MPRPATPDTQHLIQLSDLHLLEDAAQGVDWCEACRGLDTDATLQAVLDEMQLSEPRIDALVVTGDIAQTPTPATYRRFRERLAGEGVPVYCLPGNHDDPDLLCAAEGGPVRAPASCMLGDWRLIFLDSTCGTDRPHGELGKAGLAQLAAELRAAPERPTLVLLHHPPIPVGSPWLDAIGLRDGAALLALLRGHRQVRAVLCGHVHQALDRTVDGVRVLAAPSTCLQFEPGTAEPRYAALPPAYRWLTLHADGGIDTGVRWVGAPAGAPPAAARGS